MIDLTNEQWALGMAGAFFIGLSKGGVPGIGNVTAGIYAVVFASKASVGILLPVLISADIVAILIYRKHADWTFVVKLMPWTAVGLLMGWYFFGQINDRQVQILIGIILISMTGAQWLRQWLHRKQDAASVIPSSRVFAGGAGVLVGFTTMIANAAGPVASLYFIAMRLPKYAFIGTIAWFFFIVNCVKIPFMVHREVLHFDSLIVSASFFPASILGTLIAPFIVKRIDQKLFENLIWFFIVVAGIGLLVLPDWPTLLFQYASQKYQGTLD